MDHGNRERHVALAVEMADRGSRTNKIRVRRKNAIGRAERLARQNAALSAETAKLTESADTDAVSGLGSRRLLEERVASLQARRRSAICTAVIGDVDDIKSIDDRPQPRRRRLISPGQPAAKAALSARSRSSSLRRVSTDATMTPTATTPIRIVETALISGVTPSRTWL